MVREVEHSRPKGATRSSFQAAKISLGKYGAQYDQVRIYCTHHLQYENPPEPVKSELTTILDQVASK